MSGQMIKYMIIMLICKTNAQFFGNYFNDDKNQSKPIPVDQYVQGLNQTMVSKLIQEVFKYYSSGVKTFCMDHSVEIIMSLITIAIMIYCIRRIYKGRQINVSQVHEENTNKNMCDRTENQSHTSTNDGSGTNDNKTTQRLNKSDLIQAEQLNQLDD